MLKAVDYDQTQHVGYAAGRDLGRANAQAWARVFCEQAPIHRPLWTLDLGAGTGRFTTMLAETFGGPALGVEPSERMRAIAIERTTDPRVRFEPGRAEAIPAPDAAFDLVLMFLSFHHVADRAAAADEIARVLRPGGRLLIRSQFSDRFPEIGWHAYFPRARAIELEMFPSLGEVEAVFARVGLRPIALVSIEEQFGASLAEHAEKLRHRAISTFDHMSEDEIADGFARLDAAVARDTTPAPVEARSDLLVLGGV
jgi:ubiquinone/menaquinone biosynthesis C-methylase UbiE